MYVGVQLESPEGWESFKKGVRYYMAGDRIDSIEGTTISTVLIVWFTQSAKRWQSWRVHTMALPRSDFEQALTNNPPLLRKSSHQFTLPPWLEDVDDVNFDNIQERRQASLAKKSRNGQEIRSYRQQVEARLIKIAPALEIADDILKASDPLREIYNAVKSDKKCHAHRAQVWFFAFVLHGQSEWALKQPTHKNGGWARESIAHRDKKFGRPSLAGSGFGWSSAKMREFIVECYQKYVDVGKTMISIHRNALRDDFGCVTVPDEDGNDTWVHPNNKSFPTYGQFRYVVVDELGLEHVQTQLYGQPRMKSNANVNIENQTGQYGSILENFQVDAYYVLDRPKSVLTDEPTEPLVVAEGVCVTTGAIVGVGFALGSETGEAYRSMLFCMAVPAHYRARIFGIPVDKLNWVMQGICSAFTSDRGPAGHRKFAENLEQRFPVKTIAPSYDGQAKAPVETTHPKSVHLEGQPSFVVSKLNVLQMMKREILRAVAKNHSKDISPRLSNQAIHDFNTERRVATPHHYWQYLSERLRTCARDISIEEAVRSFWTPTKLPVDANGVRFRHRHFTAKDLTTSSLMKKVGLVNNLQVDAYILSLVVRIIWVEIDGRLIELEASTRVRVGDDDQQITLSEYEATADILAKLQSKTRVSAQAAVNRAEADCEEITGVAWDAGTRKKGSAGKPSGSAAHEAKITKGQRARKVA